MQQTEINRAVARATGETVATIKRLGFLLAEPSAIVADPDAPELRPHVIDWDALDLDGPTDANAESQHEPAIA